jgi:hypothetical protein
MYTSRKPVSHRAHASDLPVLGRLLAPLTAVVVVVIVIVLLIVINSHHSPSGGAAAVVPGSHTPAPGSSQASSQHPSQPPSTKPSGSVTPSADAKPTKSAKPTSSAKPSTSTAPSTDTTSAVPPAVTTAMAPVQVLNNSRRTGLAATVASEVQAKGWTIALIGNLRGQVSEPTVYYSPGNRAAAKHLASEFTSITRIAPAADLGISAPGVTLVLTQSWAD